MHILVFPQLLESSFFPTRALQVWLMFSFPLALVISPTFWSPSHSNSIARPVTKDSSSRPTFYNFVRCKASHQLKPQFVSCYPSSIPFPGFHLVVLPIQKRSWWLSRLSLSYASALREFSLASIRHFRFHASRVLLSKQDWGTKQHSLLNSAFCTSFCYNSILLPCSTLSAVLLPVLPSMTTSTFNSSILLNL